MCWLCDEFGDPEYGNGSWYLNPWNYARNMYKLRDPKAGMKGPEAGLETGARKGPGMGDLMAAVENNDRTEYDRITTIMQESGQGSQVVPLEDADRILELCSPVALMSCICRKGSRAID